MSPDQTGNANSKSEVLEVEEGDIQNLFRSRLKKNYDMDTYKLESTEHNITHITQNGLSHKHYPSEVK